MQSLSTSLEENKAYFQGRFAHSMDFITREFTLAGRKAALFAVDGLINKEIIALSVMEPLLKTQDYPPAPQAMLAHIERAVLSAAELKHERDLEKLLTLLMSGFVLLCVDGCDDGLVSGVQGFAYRGPQEPQNEVMQRGAKDGFTESNQLNMAMIRRRMKNPDLKFQPLEVGSQSHTPVVLCYLEGAAAPKLLRQVRQVLEDCPLQTVLGAGYLTGFLDKGRVFSGVGMAERPDVNVKIAATYEPDEENRYEIESAAMLRKEDQELCDKVSEILQSMIDDGTLYDLTVKYFGEAVADSTSIYQK